MFNVTPSGIESGAEPIFDWHGEVVVKALDVEDFANAGSRKLGIELEHGFEGFAAHWAHRRRAGANMVLILAVVFLAQISGVAGPLIYRLSQPKSRDSARGSRSRALFTDLMQPLIRAHCAIVCSA
jgi:hypothetical protein